MKKLLIIALLFLTLQMFCQNYSKAYQAEYYKEKIDEFVTLSMIYDPESRNLIIIYEIKDKMLDEIEAFILMRDRIKLFAKDKGFYHYVTYSNDVIKHRNNSAEFTRFIVFYE